MRIGEVWYRGTADAVLQNLNLIDDFDPDLVAVFGADHIYRMDVNQMVAFHREHDADVTVAARPVPLVRGLELRRSRRRRERPRRRLRREAGGPRAMPGNPGQALVSMGNYLFSRQRARGRAPRGRPPEHRPRLREDASSRRWCPTARVFAYDFQANEVPGIKPYEEPGYWRDVGDARGVLARAHGPAGRDARASTSTTGAGRSTPAATTGRRRGSSAASSRTPRSARAPSSCGPPSGTRSSGAACG